MVKILNLTQHEVTEEQKKAGVIEPASKGYIRGLLTFEELPNKKEMERRARELAWLAEAYRSEGITKVMIGGAPYFMSTLEKVGRNPLESGQCFLLFEREKGKGKVISGKCRNPLESGQCFLQHPSFFTDYRKLNTPFAGTSLFLCFLFPSLTYLLP